MKNQLAFQEVTTYQQLTDTLQQHKQRYITQGYLNSDSVIVGEESLNNLSEEKQQRLLGYTHVIDKVMNQSGNHRGNLLHKIPTIVVSSIYLNYYEDLIKSYHPKCFAMLAKYSILEEPKDYPKIVNLFDPETLNIIVNKTPDYMLQEEFMSLVEHTQEEYLSKEDLHQYLIQTSNKELFQKELEIQTEIMKEEENNESRRI